MLKRIIFLALSVIAMTSAGQTPSSVYKKLEEEAVRLESKVISWRRHIHQYPELSNREHKTGQYIARHLIGLGLEVDTAIAHTGVVALLRSGRPGPILALRADMDALPVTERNSLPFASTQKATYNGQEVGVMHACGHDAHVAILMGVAEILAKNKKMFKGDVKFVFQPAEEGAPAGEEGGAPLMIKEGILENPKVDAIIGLHVQAIRKLGQIGYKSAGMMAAADWFTIKVTGKQAHGGAPWKGVDPIVVSAQIITALQTIVSRQTDLTKEPAVITIGKINGGVRENIIPESVEMAGTIRTFDIAMQNDIHERIKRTAEKVAEASGATAEVVFDKKYPLTYNDPVLTGSLVNSLRRAAGSDNVIQIPADPGAEDFAYYVQKVPGLYFFVGACPPEIDPAKAPSHHTPDFMMDEKALLVGMKSLLNLTVDYLNSKK